jgi:hypothetical protein
MARTMNRPAILLLLLATGPALAAPGGPIDRLQSGSYVCELPGDATGPAGIRAPEHDFAVVNSSTYTMGRASGTYLVTGDLVAMTSGPKRGQKFHRLSDNFLRQIGPDGKDGPLRCVRQVVNNS